MTHGMSAWVCVPAQIIPPKLPAMLDTACASKTTQAQSNLLRLTNLEKPSCTHSLASFTLLEILDQSFS
eukprot:1156026-Pelagomonas_calceolata.AAC.4